MDYLLFIISILPVILICTYIYYKDKNKEPKSLLIKLFILGISSIFIVFVLSYIMTYIFPIFNKETTNMNFIEIFLYTFILVATIEEVCKWLIVYYFGYKSKENDEVYDLIVYATFVGLGFACIENILYVFLNQSIQIGILRGVFSIPGHACFAIAMGYYLSKARIYKKRGNISLSRKNMLFSILVPIILHGIYDYCLLSNYLVFIIIFFIFVIFLFKISLSRLKELSNMINDNKTT